MRLRQSSVPESGSYEWTGGVFGDAMEILLKTRRRKRAFIRNMEVDVCCCSKP